ncbi:hypothetical protein SELMODRAFT_441107 [Selaginella moellendorffii]|uniref:FAD dependent oxidoreductase domain-containing protein n=1 Tax=Selaginella moellendorffii TaxID=88036 RepID=D8RGK3_SELML|nr:probable sarcosine oxidase [Selaginella moellendorffii]EFJ28372.1 hypothetical protein SELMODRAFT_441107 [Selaginella moellendorffii]|eukprot:XP_002970242.1 probable sarcosine oxidase [Selaginella moellendorffii]
MKEALEGCFDAAIVGAGIMGLCTAYELARRGKSVIVLEQFDLLHRRGSSHGESRTLRLTYPESYYTLMARSALDLWKSAQREAGFEVYKRTGQLDFGAADHPGLQQLIAACREHGIHHQVFGREEFRQKQPRIAGILDLPEGCIGVWTEEAGVLRATKACAMFLALATRHGAIVRDNARVTKISPGWKDSRGEKSVLVATGKGSVLAKKCIIASGAWVPRIVEENFGLVLPVQPLHTTIAYWEVTDRSKHAEFLAGNGFPTFAFYNEKYFYGTPSLEFPGLIKASIHGGTPCDADDRCYIPDVEELKRIMSPWMERAFGKNVRCDAPAMAEACMYSMTPDQDFILDVLPGTQEQVLVAAGFSGHGFKMAPLVGKVMADLAESGASPEVPLELFSLQRFRRSAFGNEKSFDPVKELSTLRL